MNDNNDKEDEQPIKKVKLNEDDNAGTCAICLESENLLPKHGCFQCTETAFQICEGCHKSCLSRLCPICRGEYAPVIYQRYPVDLPIPYNPSNYTDPQERMNATVTLNFSVQLIGKVNSAVWCPDEKVIHFVLPTHNNDRTDDSDESIIASITVNDDQIDENGNFHFTNKIWDLLEQKAIDEEGEEEESLDTEGEGPNRDIDPDEPTYCTCKRVEYGHMVECAKQDCPFKWFHFRCVGLTRATTPTSPWCCANCITEKEDTDPITTDQEPSFKIVQTGTSTEALSNIDSDERGSALLVVLNETLNDPERFNNQEVESAAVLGALEFAQTSSADARKWLISKLLKPTAVFMTEEEPTFILEMLNEILRFGRVE